MDPVLENMNLSFLAQNHSSLTRLKQSFIDVKCTILLNLSFLTALSLSIGSRLHGLELFLSLKEIFSLLLIFTNFWNSRN